MSGPDKPPATHAGAVRLFHVAGISVFLHWSWAVVAVIEIQLRAGAYESRIWNVAEYLSIFGIVLLHEFGHALACRSVGGRADRILLWPLGGIAYVDPPFRPGALLWSIAAGPLVNVILLVPTLGAAVIVPALPGATQDLQHFVEFVAIINAVLLIFNLLPIYPLDGGQVVRALLWYVIGPFRSLSVAAVIGLLGSAAVIMLALYLQDWWLIILAAFGAQRSWYGLTAARRLSALAAVERRSALRCPNCREPPPVGGFWHCPCGHAFDVFAEHAGCPKCRRVFDHARCPRCGHDSPYLAWHAMAAVTP